MRSIRERPAEAEGREVPGYREGDLIKGTFHGCAVGTLVDRSSHHIILARVDEATAESVLEGFTRLRTSPRHSQTLTKTQGKEMARHRDWNSRRGFAWFACPHSSWQRPTNENPNGLLRQYFPRGTGASEYLQRTLTQVTEELNDRPRKSLRFRTPFEVVAQQLRDLSAGVVLQT